MPVELTQIQPTVYLLSYHGKVTDKQLEVAYQEILKLEDLVYLLTDATEMLYTDDMLFNDDLGELMVPKLTGDMMKTVVVVLPEDHPLKRQATKFHTGAGSLQKVKFVVSRDKGLELIADLLNE